jgi:hypothetical protein
MGGAQSQQATEAKLQAKQAKLQAKLVARYGLLSGGCER